MPVADLSTIKSFTLLKKKNTNLKEGKEDGKA